MANGSRFAHGPELLPSEYLRFFEANGWVCLTCVLSDEIVDGLRKVACTDQYADREPDRSRVAISQDVAVARTAAEPVSLWLIREYMQDPGHRDGPLAGHGGCWAGTTASVRCKVGTPTTRITGAFRHPLKSPSSPARPASACNATSASPISTKVGGATAFKLGSHALNEGPPDDWGTAARYASRTYRAEHGLPYNGPDADIVEAPGGSIILYDARTWHRAGVNRTDNRRAAMLQAMVPMYVMPKADMSGAYKQYAASPVYSEITDRERAELEALLVRRLPGPPLHGALGTDPDLVALVQKTEEGRAGY